MENTIKPINNELILYILYSKLGITIYIPIQNPIIHPIPNFTRNLNPFLRFILSLETRLFNELINLSYIPRINNIVPPETPGTESAKAIHKPPNIKFNIFISP